MSNRLLSRFFKVIVINLDLRKMFSTKVVERTNMNTICHIHFLRRTRRFLEKLDISRISENYAALHNLPFRVEISRTRAFVSLITNIPSKMTTTSQTYFFKYN